ncbi:MAG: 50S ribosomal protein L23 [Candidatus Sumerlaeia bacterium]|nr:50S ribosomal protein L23 [Candidatus Sumerlaeia bacterium]
MRSPYKIILRPVFTERAVALQQLADPQYTFDVLPDANKREIRSAVEQAFNVKVSAVNTIVRKGKAGRFGFSRMGRRAERKLAIVTLAPGQKIEFV